MNTNQSINSLRTEKDKLSQRLAEAENAVSAIKGELKGIDRAIAILSGPEAETDTIKVDAERLTRGALKEAVLGLLGERTEGIKASDLVDLSKARGQLLDRGSVASLLSRLAKDGVIDFDKETRRYNAKRKPHPGLPPLPPLLPNLRTVA